MEATTPSQRYAAGVARGDWRDDPAQHPALAELDRIHEAIVDSAQDGWLDRLSAFWKKPEPVKGLYFWGGVGRGKTFLVDLFYEGLPLEQKRRTHFHRFMREVHERLRTIMVREGRAIWELAQERRVSWRTAAYIHALARLAAEEGLLYTFEHRDDGHTLVLTDRVGGHTEYFGSVTLR